MNRDEKKPKWIFAIKKGGKVYRYMVRMIVKGKRVYLGCFETIEAAQAAIEQHRRKHE